MNEYSEPAERLKNLFEKIRQNHPDWNDEHILRAILEDDSHPLSDDERRRIVECLEIMENLEESMDRMVCCVCPMPSWKRFIKEIYNKH